jgi:hypothetical protein
MDPSGNLVSTEENDEGQHTRRSPNALSIDSKSASLHTSHLEKFCESGEEYSSDQDEHDAGAPRLANASVNEKLEKSVRVSMSSPELSFGYSNGLGGSNRP